MRQIRCVIATALVSIFVAVAGRAETVALVPYRIDGDGITASLTGRPGDVDRGAALFANRQISTCPLCHSDPSQSQASAAAIGPSLSGVGSRLSAAQLRLRIVDAASVNPETIMPSFYVVTGLKRVGRPWQGRPVLDAAQIEDIVAYLVTLHAP